MTTFRAETYQNEFLAEGASEVDAIVTITSGPGGDPAGAVGMRTPGSTEAVEIILLDCSGSMGQPPTKIQQARKATAAAIDCIRDGVWFAVVRGSNIAVPVYPVPTGLIPASEATRTAAKQAVARLMPEGGTAIGTWLEAATSLCATRPNAIHHAILLTDGRNESQPIADFDAAIASSKGRFQCDCRGVGTDWDVAELRKVASALLGSVDIVADPHELEADFRSMTEQAMGKAVRKVELRVWAPQGATVLFVKQVAPTIEDLTTRAEPVNALTFDYPTGSWGEEARDYHVCIRVNAATVGSEMLAARVSLVVGDEVVSQALVKAIWTDDLALSTRINREVAHYTGQAELAQAIQEGLEARNSGDEGTATTRLGRAVQLAAESGNDATTKLLAKVVDVEDAATGTVRLRRDVDEADEMALDTRSTKTARVTR